MCIFLSDICFGRWDTSEHELADLNYLHTKWPGKDYANEGEVSYSRVNKPFWDLLDRFQTPRMPWHDIHCAVDGQAARYVAKSFIQVSPSFQTCF